MADNNIEIEIQVKIEKPEILIKFLEENASFKEEIHQLDKYFSPTHRNFGAVRPVEEWLRVRKSGNKASFDYKHLRFDKNGKNYSCDQYETNIGDSDQMEKILAVLNFAPLITVNKKRKIWMYKDYEIAVDNIEGLGDFVEIEYLGKKENLDPKEVTGEMVAFLKKIGYQKIYRSYLGYPFQLLFPQEIKYEEE